MDIDCTDIYRGTGAVCNAVSGCIPYHTAAYGHGSCPVIDSGGKVMCRIICLPCSITDRILSAYFCICKGGCHIYLRIVVCLIADAVCCSSEYQCIRHGKAVVVIHTVRCTLAYVPSLGCRTGAAVGQCGLIPAVEVYPCADIQCASGISCRR